MPRDCVSTEISRGYRRIVLTMFVGIKLIVKAYLRGVANLHNVRRTRANRLLHTADYQSLY
jgi:hypothetical protein